MSKVKLFSLFLFLLFGGVIQATNWYVATSGNNTTNNGRSVDTPFLTIVNAISSASDGDVIFIAAGTYTERLLDPGNKSLTFVGDGGNGGGASTTIIQGNTKSTGPSHGSVFNFKTQITSDRSYTFQDLTVRYGYKGTGSGAGIIDSTGTAATLTLSMTRCAILSNRTNANTSLGAGIYLGGKVSTILTDCEIASNQTKTGNVGAGGGGICINAIGTTCPLVLNRCYVHDNQSARGGGAGLLFMSTNTTTPVDITIKNSTFKANSLNYTGGTGAAYAKGAGICVFAGNSGSAAVNHKLWIENSTITDNTSNGIDACGNGVFFSSWTSTGTTNNTQTVSINHSTIYNNRGTSASSTSVGGEGVCISSAGKYPTNLIMNNSIVIGNTAAAAGSNASQVGSNTASGSQTTYISPVGASGSQLYNNIFGNAGIIGGWISDNNSATYDFHNNINSSTTSTNLAFGSLSSDATPVLPIGQTSIARNYITTNYLSPALSADQIGQLRSTYPDAGAYEFQASSGATDYFRSRNSGLWSNSAIWSGSADGLDWYNATLSPTSSATNVSIEGGYTVTADAASTSISGLSIASGSTLTVPAGNQFTVNTSLTNNGTLNLNSDATGTATLLTPASISGSGTANVQQYLTSGRNWYISSPVSDATSGALNTATKVYKYNEPSAQFVEASGVLNPMTGYISQGTISNGAITFSGTLNNSEKTIALTRSTGVAKSGFNLVGNPYPSYVSWDAATKTNLESTIWYRTKNAANTAYTFDTYNAASQVGTSNNGNKVNSHIPPMQAFWVLVRSGNTSGSLTFDNSMRSHKGSQTTDLGTVPDVNLRSASVESLNQKILRLNVSNGVVGDEAVVVFNGNASNDLDDFDSYKMSNGAPSVPEIYTKTGDHDLVINGLNSVETVNVLPLGFNTGQSNSFTIQATQVSNFGGVKIILRDNVKNKEQELTNGEAYAFTSDATTTDTRFSLIFKVSSIATGGDDAESDNVLIFSNCAGQIRAIGNKAFAAKDIATVYNAIGCKVTNCKLANSSSILAENLTPGVYVVVLQVNGEKKTEKVVVN